jgi:hypothetical protein
VRHRRLFAETVEAFEMFGCDISSAAIAHAKHRLPQLSERLMAQRLEDGGQTGKGLMPCVLGRDWACD